MSTGDEVYQRQHALAGAEKRGAPKVLNFMRAVAEMLPHDSQNDQLASSLYRLAYRTSQAVSSGNGLSFRSAERIADLLKRPAVQHRGASAAPSEPRRSAWSPELGRREQPSGRS